MLICVTNRVLCHENFIDRLVKISHKAAAIILREKDLDEEQYTSLVEKCLFSGIGKRTKLIVNTYMGAAKKAGIKDIQLSFRDFVKYKNEYSDFDSVGVSVHSADEARYAEELGADYLITGHIFETSCKKNLPPRGITYLESVCHSVSCPVFAIGGINEENFADVISSGAAGICIMSQMMECSDVEMILNKYCSCGD